MMTIKEESELEQLEAHTAKFEADMEKLDREHEAKMKRIDLISNLLPVVIVVVFAAVLIFSIWKKNHP